MNSNGLKKWLGLWPLLLPILIFLPGRDGFPYPSPEAAYSDLAISHYPNAIFIKNAIRTYGRVPLWSPTILSGYPFMANPLAGLWYLPGWLALVLPLPLGFNLTAILHILFGGVGMYYLLRAEKLSGRAALFGALAFESLPKVFAHYGAGHLTLIYAIPWTPWLLLAARAGSTNSIRTKFWLKVRRFLPGIILALIILADIRWAAYATLIWILYVIAHSQFGFVLGLHQRIQTLISNLQSLFTQIFLAILLAAPLIFPLIEYTQLSTRANIAAEETLLLSLPPIRLLGLFFPNFGGNHELMVYFGAGVAILIIFKLFGGGRKKIENFWLVLGGFGLLMALGVNIPGFLNLAQLPGFSLLRVPSRALFMSGLAFAALSAHACERLLSASNSSNKRWLNLTLVGLVFLTSALAGIVWVSTQEFPLSFVWGAGMVLVTALGVGLRFRGRISPNLWFGLLIGLALIDWGAVHWSTLSFRPKAAVFTEQAEVVQFLIQQEGHFRTYSPSYSLPQQVGARFDLEMADGVDPLQLADYAEFMSVATGIPAEGYSVTLPPFEDGDPTRDNQEHIPDPALLGQFNVKYILAEFDLVADDLLFTTQFGKTRIYENQAYLPRAWVQDRNSNLGDNPRPVQWIEWQPNRITIIAEGPGLLVLSEIAYPGWRVKLNGIPAQLKAANGILRSVELEPGRHEVSFVFQPVSLYAGWLACGLGLIFIWFKSRQFGLRPGSNANTLVITSDDEYESR